MDEMLSLTTADTASSPSPDIASSSAEFLVPNVLSYPLTIEAGGSLQVPIRFQPISFGPKSAKITVTATTRPVREEYGRFRECAFRKARRHRVAHASEE